MTTVDRMYGENIDQDLDDRFMDAFPPTSNIPLASTGRTVRWQRFEKDNPLWLRDHIMDLQARLREAQMSLWSLCSQPDETGNIARQYRTQIHECPYFKGTIAGLLGQTTPTTKPQATPVDGLADLRQELKEVKALIEKTKPSPTPHSAEPGIFRGCSL